MIVAALIVDAIFSLLGWVPSGPRPSRAHVFAGIELDYKFWLNLAATIVFVALNWLTVRRGAVDPVCGMRVDRATAVVRRTPAGTRYFCSEHCAASFDAGAAHGGGAQGNGGPGAAHGHAAHGDSGARRTCPLIAGTGFRLVNNLHISRVIGHTEKRCRARRARSGCWQS